jgi:hypothetical protein
VNPVSSPVLFGELRVSVSEQGQLQESANSDGEQQPATAIRGSGLTSGCGMFTTGSPLTGAPMSSRLLSL